MPGNGQNRVINFLIRTLTSYPLHSNNYPGSSWEIMIPFWGSNCIQWPNSLTQVHEPGGVESQTYYWVSYQGGYSSAEYNQMLPVDGREHGRAIRYFDCQPIVEWLVTKGTPLSDCKWSRQPKTWDGLVSGATMLQPESPDQTGTETP